MSSSMIHMRNADTSHMEGVLLYLFDDTHNLLPCSYDTLDISYITLKPKPGAQNLTLGRTPPRGPFWPKTRRFWPDQAVRVYLTRLG